MSAAETLATLVALARAGAPRALSDALLLRAAAVLRGARVELPGGDGVAGGQGAAPARALVGRWRGVGALEFPDDLAPDSLARLVSALAHAEDAVQAVAAAAPHGVTASPGGHSRATLLAAVRRVEERLASSGAAVPLAPPSAPVRRALAASLEVATDDDLLLAACVVASPDPRVRRAVRCALVAARVARARGLPAADVLACALAALSGTVPSDALGQLRRVASPEAGSTEVARTVALLGVAYADGRHAGSALARSLAVALAWERVAGEAPRLLHAEALARLRADRRLDPATVEALADALGPYPPGSAWVLRDGALGVVMDRPSGRARLRVLFDADGRCVADRALVSAADVQPHAPIDLHELAVDPTAALLG